MLLQRARELGIHTFQISNDLKQLKQELAFFAELGYLGYHLLVRDSISFFLLENIN
jgi:hypothetical protein